MLLKQALPNSGNTPFLQNNIIHILSGPVCWFTAKLIIMSNSSALVLHLLHIHWFAKTADSKTPVAQDEAIKTAEVIFHYIAKSYLETSTSHDDAATTQAPKATVKPPI